MPCPVQVDAPRRGCGAGRTRRGRGLVALLALVALALGSPGCPRGGGDGVAAGASPGAAGGAVPTGTVRGLVRLAQAEPLPEARAAPHASCEPGADRPRRDLLVDPETRGIGDVIVWALDAPPARPGAAAPGRIVLDQKGCEFVPRAQATTAGSELLIRNSDPVLHNIHARFEGDRALFNVGMAPGNPDLPIVLRRPGLIGVRCDVHPWMGASILVVEHPFATVTGTRGAFRLDLPAGPRRLRFRHERLGERDVAVEVRVGEVVSVEVELPAR